MKVAFVGSNPSLGGPNSPAIKNLRKWICGMGVGDYLFVNVSNSTTPDNRPLKKSEFELSRLAFDLAGYEKVVALGRTASEALELIGVAHFRLPHPSPKNRTLNDERHVNSLLKSCMCYLEVEGGHKC